MDINNLVFFPAIPEVIEVLNKYCNYETIQDGYFTTVFDLNIGVIHKYNFDFYQFHAFDTNYWEWTFARPSRTMRVTQRAFLTPDFYEQLKKNHNRLGFDKEAEKFIKKLDRMGPNQLNSFFRIAWFYVANPRLMTIRPDFDGKSSQWLPQFGANPDYYKIVKWKFPRMWTERDWDFQGITNGARIKEVRYDYRFNERTAYERFRYDNMDYFFHTLETYLGFKIIVKPLHTIAFYVVKYIINVQFANYYFYLTYEWVPFSLGNCYYLIAEYYQHIIFYKSIGKSFNFELITALATQFLFFNALTLGFLAFEEDEAEDEDEDEEYDEEDDDEEPAQAEEDVTYLPGWQEYDWHQSSCTLYLKRLGRFSEERRVECFATEEYKYGDEERGYRTKYRLQRNFIIELEMKNHIKRKKGYNIAYYLELNHITLNNKLYWRVFWKKFNKYKRLHRENILALNAYLFNLYNRDITKVFNAKNMYLYALARFQMWGAYTNVGAHRPLNRNINYYSLMLVSLIFFIGLLIWGWEKVYWFDKRFNYDDLYYRQLMLVDHARYKDHLRFNTKTPLLRSPHGAQTLISPREFQLVQSPNNREIVQRKPFKITIKVFTRPFCKLYLPLPLNKGEFFSEIVSDFFNKHFRLAYRRIEISTNPSFLYKNEVLIRFKHPGYRRRFF